MNMSVTKAKVAMEMIACLEVIDKDERWEMVVEDMTVVSYDGTCMSRVRTLVANDFLSDILSFWAHPQLWVKWQRPTGWRRFHYQP